MSRHRETCFAVLTHAAAGLDPAFTGIADVAAGLTEAPRTHAEVLAAGRRLAGALATLVRATLDAAGNS